MEVVSESPGTPTHAYSHDGTDQPATCGFILDVHDGLTEVCGEPKDAPVHRSAENSDLWQGLDERPQPPVEVDQRTNDPAPEVVGDEASHTPYSPARNKEDRKARGLSMIGVGWPAMGRLDAWGRELYLAFDEMPYLVGSAAAGKDWRDVDIRIILDDEAYDRDFGRKGEPDRANLRWAALCTAISIWGREVTGLPIDFQFQRQTEANKHDGGNRRVAIGLQLSQEPYRRG